MRPSVTEDNLIFLVGYCRVLFNQNFMDTLQLLNVEMCIYCFIAFQDLLLHGFMVAVIHVVMLHILNIMTAFSVTRRTANPLLFYAYHFSNVSIVVNLCLFVPYFGDILRMYTLTCQKPWESDHYRTWSHYPCKMQQLEMASISKFQKDEEPCHLDFCRQCHDICKCRCFRVNSPLVTVIKNMWAINALSSFDGNAFRQVFSVHTWHRRSRVIKCSYSSRNRMFSPLWDIVPLSIITIAFPWTDCWCSYWLTRCHCRTDIDLSISKMSR